MKSELRWRTNSRFHSDFQSFIQFLLKPSAAGSSHHAIRPNNIYGWCRIPIIAILCVLCALFIFYPVIQSIIIIPPKESLLKAPWWQVIVLLPFIEEMLFRFGLRRLDPYFFLLGAVLLLFGLAFLNSFFSGLLLYFIALFCVLALTWIFISHPDHSYQTAKHYKRLLPWMVHFSCVAFASIHLFNFPLELLSANNWFLAPVLVSPQYCFAWVLAWIRFQSGIFSAFLLHASYNGLIFLIVHFFS